MRCAAQRAAASPQVPPDHLPSPSCPVPRQQLRPARRARTVGQPPAGRLRRWRRVPRGEPSLCSLCLSRHVRLVAGRQQVRTHEASNEFMCPCHGSQEFWNCADIRILPEGARVPSPSPSPSPSPVVPVAPPVLDPNPSSPAPSGNATLTDPCRSGNATCYCAWQSRDGMFADAEAGCAVSAHASVLLSLHRTAWPACCRCGGLLMHVLHPIAGVLPLHRAGVLLPLLPSGAGL